MPDYGPGFRRLQTRMGPKKLEALRLQVLEEQKEALAEKGRERVEEQNRTTYKDYPPPQKPKRRK